MAHNNRDIAQEGAEDFLSKELWECVDETFEKHGWNEQLIVKTSKRDAVHRIVRTHIASFKYVPKRIAALKECIGVMGSFCLHVNKTTREIKHVWNLPFERRGNIVIPDGRASSLILDSVSSVKGGNKLNPAVYASLGMGV